jgi:ABC-type glycerol-3-phosphate transport system permease component
VSASVVVQRSQATEARARARAKFLRLLPFEVAWAIVAFGGAIMFVVPFAWMLSTSLKGEAQIFVFPPIWIPDPIKWENYPQVFTIQPTALFLRNTVIVAGLAVLGDLISSSLVAFGFARLRFRGRDKLFILLLATLMLPQHVTLIPHYILFRYLGWINSWAPLIVPYWFATPLAVFLLRQFLMTISYEIDDAARIDGAGFFDLYWRIAMPLAKPAIGVIAMMAIVTRWNEFTEPLIYLSTKDQFTISVGLRAFQTEQNFYYVHLLMASSTIAVLPLIALFFVGQKFFVQGISLSGMR